MFLLSNFLSNLLNKLKYIIYNKLKEKYVTHFNIHNEFIRNNIPITCYKKIKCLITKDEFGMTYILLYSIIIHKKRGKNTAIGGPWSVVRGRGNGIY